MTEPIFKSAHDALVFAFNYSGQAFARTTIVPVASKGIGLGGLDGAAQAGIIRAEVKKLGQLQEALLTARYAPIWLPCDCGHPCCKGKVKNAEWEAAIPWIVLDVSKNLFQGKYRGVVLYCIQAYYSQAPYTATDIAELAGVSVSTITRKMKTIRLYLRGNRHHEGMDAIAYRSAELVLIEAGIVNA